MHDGPPWDQTARAIKAMGFGSTEFIGMSSEELDSYWLPHAASLRQQCEDIELSISQFAVFHSITAELLNPDQRLRQGVLNDLRKAAAVSAELGANQLNFVAPWPYGIVPPDGGHWYIPRNYYVNDAGGAPKLAMSLPEAQLIGDRVWDDWVSVVRQVVENCKAEGAVFAVENHPMTMVSNTDAYLRLWDHVKDPALAISLDTGWLSLTREYLPTAILRLSGHLRHLQLRDIDGFAKGFSVPGLGVIDFAGLASTLRAIGYQGDVNIELSKDEGYFEDRSDVVPFSRALIQKHFDKI